MRKGFLSAKQSTRKDVHPTKPLNGYPLGVHPGAGPESRQTEELLARCGALLDARQISAARRVFQALPKSKLSDATVSALRSRCAAVETKAKERAIEALETCASGKGPPIEAFLSLFCAGVEDCSLWAKVTDALARSLGKFGTMLLEVGAIHSNSILLVERPISELRQVLLFRAGAAEWHSLPAAYDAAMAQVGQGQAQVTRVLCGAGWLQGAAATFKAEMWPAVCEGDRLELGPNQPDSPPRNQDWPPVRCAPELLQGTLPAISLEDALGPAGAPAVVKDAQLLHGALQRWSLDFFLDTVPSGDEASLFSVYRAAEPKRCFRYAGAREGSDEEEAKYSLESEDCGFGGFYLLFPFHPMFFQHRKFRKPQKTHHHLGTCAKDFSYS